MSMLMYRLLCFRVVAYLRLLADFLAFERLAVLRFAAVRFTVFFVAFFFVAIVAPFFWMVYVHFILRVSVLKYQLQYFC